jgi:hypothetical protein
LNLGFPEFLENYPSDIFYHKGHQGSTKDTKLDVDNAFLDVLCAPSSGFSARQKIQNSLCFKINHLALETKKSKKISQKICFSPAHCIIFAHAETKMSYQKHFSTRHHTLTLPHPSHPHPILRM